MHLLSLFLPVCVHERLISSTCLLPTLMQAVFVGMAGAALTQLTRSGAGWVCAGGCGALCSVSQALQREPRVFTLQLGWGKPREAPSDIAATLSEVQEQVRPGGLGWAGLG